MKTIELDEHFKIINDTYSFTLIFEEMRVKTNKKTLLEEDFKFEDKWYYPRLSDCLTKYLELSLKECEDIQKINTKLNIIENKINELKTIVFKK